MARIIVVTSGKGGVGKSTLVANLGSELAKEFKVVLIDADLGLKNLDCILGLENRVIFDIEDVIENRANLMQALVNDKKRENLYILPACRNLDVTKVDFKYMEKIVLELQDKFDYIFIDCPAGIERGFFNAINNANEAIVVASLDISSIRDADKVIGILNQRGINEVGLVINKYNPEKQSSSSLTIEDALEVLNIPLLGVVYYEEMMSNISNKAEVILDYEKELASKCYKNISKRLQGENIPILKYKKKSLFSKIFS